MTQPTDKVREAFEAWWLTTFIEDDYKKEPSWALWQASRTAALNEAIDICFTLDSELAFNYGTVTTKLEELRDGK